MTQSRPVGSRTDLYLSRASGRLSDVETGSTFNHKTRSGGIPSDSVNCKSALVSRSLQAHAYSNLRWLAHGAFLRGENACEIAPLFNVSVSYIYKVLARRRTTGETTVRRQRHGRCLNSPPTTICCEIGWRRFQTSPLTNYGRGFCPSIKSTLATPMRGSNWAGSA